MRASLFYFSLTTTTCMNLGFYNKPFCPSFGLKFLCRVHGAIGCIGYNAPLNRYPIFFQNLFALVFVNVHEFFVWGETSLFTALFQETHKLKQCYGPLRLRNPTANCLCSKGIDLEIKKERWWRLSVPLEPVKVHCFIFWVHWIIQTKEKFSFMIKMSLTSQLKTLQHSEINPLVSSFNFITSCRNSQRWKMYDSRIDWKSGGTKNKKTRTRIVGNARSCRSDAS